ncbi:MAG: ligase-associated DNA damage response endonuclease PdeM [Proteobacteria bacterium]|nr:MAG: ligase-associated DNA damage response endonuclease PdeM [Pseudomonadota bacterium]
MAKSLSTEVRGQELTLYGRKAVYWHAKKTLILADTHWGKAEVFQEHGIPVPSTVLDSDLDELTHIVEESGAERILILGDLMHSPKGLSDNVNRTIETWRKRCSVPILSIRGNHDPKTTVFPEHWKIDWVNEPYVEGPFCFRHEPEASKDLYTWCGHIHPVLHLGRPRMRLPCFWLSPSLGVLPSFGSFTGGFAVKPKRMDNVFVVSEGEVFSLN